jgi:integrase
MSVPRSLWEVFGKREVVLSLQTPILLQARLRSRLASNWLEALFKHMKRSPNDLTPQHLDGLITDYFYQLRRDQVDHAGFLPEMTLSAREDYILELRQELQMTREQDLILRDMESEARQVEKFCKVYDMDMPDVKSPAFNQISAGIRDAGYEVTRMLIAKLSGKGEEAQVPQGRFAVGLSTGTPLVVSPAPTREAVEARTPILLEELLESFAGTQDRNKNWTEKSTKHRIQDISVFITFMKQRYGRENVHVHEVLLSDLTAFQELLQRLPSHASKKFKGLSLAQAAEKAVKEKIPPMGTTNIQKHLYLVRNMLEYAVDIGYLAESPYNRRIIKPKVVHEKDDKYRNFTMAELQTLFGSPSFNKASSVKKSGNWWVPLIALYTGARRAEIVMLEPQHVIEQEGVKCLVIADTEARRVKNDNSNRIVPLHPVLLKMGLWEYADKHKHRKSKFLFPDIVREEMADPSDAFGKRFAKLMTKLKIKDRRLVFHSFRHTFITQSRLAGVPKDVCVVFTGH